MIWEALRDNDVVYECPPRRRRWAWPRIIGATLEFVAGAVIVVTTALWLMGEF
jgi:uncharacterized integral membrane protein